MKRGLLTAILLLIFSIACFRTEHGRVKTERRQRLELMLTEKYGPPTTRADPSLQDKQSISTNWAFPSTIISLNRIKMGPPLPEDVLTISYVKNRAGKEPDNL